MKGCIDGASCDGIADSLILPASPFCASMRPGRGDGREGAHIERPGQRRLGKPGRLKLLAALFQRDVVLVLRVGMPLRNAAAVASKRPWKALNSGSALIAPHAAPPVPGEGALLHLLLRAALDCLRAEPNGPAR